MSTEVPQLENTSEHTEETVHRHYPLTCNERAAILGTRAMEIEKGATIYVEYDNSIHSALTIAEMELNQGKLPYFVRRYQPDGTVRDVPIADITLNYN